MAVSLDEQLELDFFSSIQCENSSIEKCCKSMWYRYAWVPIGVENIPVERKSAEFLSGKYIIQSNSLSPEKYNLNSDISRKEVMKVIINASWIEINDVCWEIFQDVDTDWWCKYIESALENEYIAWNQQFRPNENVTKTEALKLIFKARKLDKSYETNSWQQDYISTALYLWYIDEKFSNYNEIANRGWIFSVLAKTYPGFKKY